MAEAVCTESTGEFEVVQCDQKVSNARRRWRLIKNVGKAVRRTSITEAESGLLKALEKKRGSASSSGSSNSGSSKTEGATTNARSELRNSISLHRNSLTLKELQFLQNLLEVDDVCDDALSSTSKALETDQLYANDMSTASMASSLESISEFPTLKKSVTIQIPKESPQRDSSFRMELWRTRPASVFKPDLQIEMNDEEDEEKGEDVKTSDDTMGSPFMSYIKKIRFLSEDSDGEDTEGPDDGKEEGEKETPSTVQFTILGTSADDVSAARSHVMTPPLMDTLTFHVPFAVKEDNFWLKYSLVRDGASMEMLFSKVRSSSSTILAIETTAGEVFGSFTSTPWRHMGNNYYGSGESFLWRMRQPRLTSCDSLLDRTRLESDVEVFKWASKNQNVQLSNPNKLVVGGGEPDEDIDRRIGMSEGEMKQEDKGKEWDFGLALNGDLSSGTSGNCVTFGSPGLSKYGDTFEVSNLEVWTMTPVTDPDQAEKIELSRQFVFANIHPSINRRFSKAA